LQHNRDEEEIISDINVTPLVDIMLVLLIIFMLVSTFVDFTAIEVELPHAATGREIDTETLAVMISKNGDYYLSGEKTASFAELRERLRDKRSKKKDLQVVISADKKVYHETIVHLIDALRKMDILKFAINVEPFTDIADKEPLSGENR